MQALLLAAKLDMGHARALLALPVAQQPGAAAKVVDQGLSVREAERLVHATLHPGTRKTARRADGDVARLENELAETLGAPVRVEATRKGAGRIVIRYSSLDQLDGILTKLRRS